MSTILNALRKLERSDGGAGSPPPAPPDRPGDSGASRSRARRPVQALAAGLIVGGLAYAVMPMFLPTPSQPTPSDEAPSAPPSEKPVGAPHAAAPTQEVARAPNRRATARATPRRHSTPTPAPSRSDEVSRAASSATEPPPLPPRRIRPPPGARLQPGSGAASPPSTPPDSAEPSQATVEALPSPRRSVASSFGLYDEDSTGGSSREEAGRVRDESDEDSMRESPEPSVPTLEGESESAPPGIEVIGGVGFPKVMVESVRWHPRPERREARMEIDRAGPLHLHEGDIIAGVMIREIRPAAVELAIGDHSQVFPVEP